MSLRKKEDAPSPALARNALPQLPGVSGRASWFGSAIKQFAKLDVSRGTPLVAISKPSTVAGSTALFDVSDPDIGVSKFQKGEDKAIETTDQLYHMNLKSFLEAVQKHTMGETGKASEIFQSHESVVRLNGMAPVSKPLSSNVGPFVDFEPVSISGLSAASAYCNLTLKCTYSYLDDGSIFKAFGDGFCMVHGGLSLDEKSKAIFESCVDNAMERIKLGEEIRTEHVKRNATFNDVHQLGFGGSVITGRLPVHEACTGSEAASQAMHPAVMTTVVGHTPQWLGMPTIIREGGKFLVALDTQFSNRQKNTHSLGLFNDGSFCLTGGWMGTEYVARSDDTHIGRQIMVGEEPQSSVRFRVIAKMAEADDVYIAVNYALNPKNPRGVGFTTVCLVKFEESSGTTRFTGRVVEPDSQMRVATGKVFVEAGGVVLDDEHATSSRFDSNMSSVEMKDGHPGDGGMWKFRTFVCGDIEASVDFLHAFVVRSYKMATDLTFNPNYLKEMNSMWANDTQMYSAYGLPNDGSLGFDVGSISDKMKEIMYITKDLHDRVGNSTCNRNGPIATFSCIGDVVGDPSGKGNLDETTQVIQTELIHEFMCVHWAVNFCENKIVGNRDINKLRFLNEIAYISKPEHETYLGNISTYQKEFAAGNESNVVTLKRLLGHFCYPYTMIKDTEGNEVRGHKSFEFDKDKPILPFRAGPDGPGPFPMPIWEQRP